MNFPDPKLPPIIVVDDSQDDVFLLRHRLRLGGVENPVLTFDSPANVLACLHLAGAGGLLPRFVFADIKMPGAPELIDVLRRHPEWNDIKVVVLTYSNDPADLQRALDLRVDGYVLKFPSPEDLSDLVRNGPRFAVPHRIDAAVHALCA